MILLDTHAWIWHVTEPSKLSANQHNVIELNQNSVLGVSVISCWEVAKLVEKGRLALDRDVFPWISHALNQPGIQLLPLTVKIVVASTQLPGDFHQDPADQLLVASSRELNIPLVTSDSKIVSYAHVITVS